jgi:NAD(P)-dependent dehydrogenase (short-subunit alcohol dehydrogenase family)
VIGAGDYIGAAIVTRFAGEGFTVFAGRRHGDKLAPLVAEVEARGGQSVGRSVDARRKTRAALEVLGDCARTVPAPVPCEPTSHRDEWPLGRVRTGLRWSEMG